MIFGLCLIAFLMGFAFGMYAIRDDIKSGKIMYIGDDAYFAKKYDVKVTNDPV